MVGSKQLIAFAIALLPLVGCIGLFAFVVAGERRTWFAKCAWFAQFVKYGSVGVVSTYVQTGVFYFLGATCLACLGPDDVAVKYLGIPAADVADAVRAFRFAVATGVGFVVANVFCWLMNRAFVFRPGKFRWHVEFAMFFGAATIATLVALGLSSALIRWCGLMTTIAVGLEVVVSFLVNFFVRKFFIFKG